MLKLFTKGLMYGGLCALLGIGIALFGALLLAASVAPVVLLLFLIKWVFGF